MIQRLRVTLFCVLCGLCVLAPLGLAGGQLPPTRGEFVSAGPHEVAFTVEQDRIVIPVMINGHGPVRLVLDTGAPVILLPDTALARQLGLAIAGQVAVQGSGDGPGVTAGLATGVRVAVGGFVVDGASAVIGVGAAALPGVDGAIGGPLLQHSIVEIDWDARKIRFYDPGSGGPPSRVEAMELRVEPSLHAFIEASLYSDHGDTTVALHLDTGARAPLTLGGDLRRKLGVSPIVDSVVVAWGTQGPALGALTRLKRLQIGATTLSGVPTSLVTRDLGIPGRLGLPAIRGFRTIIDYPGRRITLEPRQWVSDIPDFTTTGILIRPTVAGALPIVMSIVSESPAHQAGIAVGDTIMSVEGVATSTLTADQLQSRLLRPDPGTSVLVTAKRGAKVISPRLVARILLP